MRVAYILCEAKDNLLSSQAGQNTGNAVLTISFVTEPLLHILHYNYLKFCYSLPMVTNNTYNVLYQVEYILYCAYMFLNFNLKANSRKFISEKISNKLCVAIKTRQLLSIGIEENKE